MSKKLKRHRHSGQRVAPPPLNSSAPVKNGDNGGPKSRTKGMLLLVALTLAVGVVAYALNVTMSPRGDRDPAIAGNAPPRTADATQQPLLSPPPSVALPSSVSGPKIQFATPVHDFGKMKGGEVAKYTYVFTNIGDRLLELTDVRVSCGCTTTGEWSRKTDPGQTGSIPIEFNSGSFSGPVAKSITVTCNDTNQPTVSLQLKATVWKPIDVTPQFAVLNVSIESPSNSTTVRIVNNMEEPLTLSPPESNNPVFSAELRTNQPGGEFELTVRTGPPPPTNNMNGVISLKTSSTNMPTLNITAYAMVQAAVVVTPAAITLPAAPMTQPAFYTVAIRNTSASALVLYDPAVNAPGVDVRLTEVEVGRHFTVTMTFPAGFEAAAGDEVELTVRSSHPQFPIIRVPARQPARPGSAVARAPSPVPPPAPRQEAALSK